ncbi:hypothetical protein [Symbiobacterium terraclitae]|uniref:hypothetical protein n=1 Tax=Symbiobacterium terraclitae TaxID=557451 RepID=UPI0035B5217D
MSFLVNLFSAGGAAGALTPALMAVLEHTDRDVLAGLLDLAGLDGAGAGDAEFRYPAPGAPQGVGEIALAQGRLWLAAVAPGEEPSAAAGDLAGDGGRLLVISAGAPAGGASPEVRWLSWERLDRWLARMAEQYDPESRTGFLLRQFRAYLPEAGIAYFTGFTPELLAAAPRALRDLGAFYRQAEEFFTQLEASLAAGGRLLRAARPQDLLAGFCFRDYAGAGQGDGDFLRIALNLEPAELQIAFWLEPGGAAHQRLRAALQEDGPLPAALRSLRPQPVLRLWSAADEQQIPVGEVDAARLGRLDWDAYTAAVQVGHPFADLSGEGLLERVAGWVQDLREALSPILTEVLH